MKQRILSLDEFINESRQISYHKIKVGSKIEYIIAGTTNQLSTGIVQSKESTRSDDYLVVLDDTTSKNVNVSMSHVANIMNETKKGDKSMGATDNWIPTDSGFTFVEFSSNGARVKDKDGKIDFWKKSPKFRGYHLIINGENYEYINTIHEE